MTYGQTHVAVEETPMRINYGLASHPSLSPRRATRSKAGLSFRATLPLEYFMEEWEV